MVSAPPELCAAAYLAYHCWQWCGGFQPALWPLYDSLHSVTDWPLQIELLEVIRSNV